MSDITIFHNPQCGTSRSVLALIRASGLFDEAWYAARYAPEDPADPIEHYVTVGAALGNDPHPLFGTAYYARQMMAQSGP